MEDAKEKIKELVERFHLNLDAYKKGSYNETQLRREFIDPFFEALGWDVQNKQGYAEQYKEVVHEDSIKVGISLKAPDYSFRIGGQRKFFLETKKPAINIKEDTSPAYQLRRYAWSAKLPLSILTDFEEFAVYDCRIKPNPSDKVSTGRIAYYTYEQYIGKFDEIYDRFSKEAVLKGSFDRYIETSKGMRGTGEVDKEFLREIESWREFLAKNFALRNPRLTVDELNFAVQQTIDRIIFLRICEDRGIESYGRLQALLNGTNTYRRLMELFYQADAKYNSGLFDFKVDTLSHTLAIDDKALKDIVEGLYYPKSPYEFSVLDAEILGNVYEQFLGKVIRLTSGHAAKVEEKPEVKKAGGVYYTPSYIVRYIVENTVGKLLEGKTPKQAEKLRILDPACGSGSFLIGAYQHLLGWHTKWYNENNPEKHATGKKPAVYRSRAGWQLTTTEKKRILLNNIYGVDIDRQAVEVTKLSLLLKVLEGENEETIGKTLALFRERALPDLKDNIRCGNSLIGPDFYDSISPTLPFIPSRQGRGKTTSPLAGEGTIISPSPSTGEGWGEGEGEYDEIRRINVFDWNDNEKGFGKVMKEGGFDAVIGNPPYVRQEMLGEYKPYFESRYTAYHGMADLYVYFIEKAVSLLREGGLFSYIVANKWMRANYGEPIRCWMKKQAIEEITDFGDLPVFQNVTTYPCILRIRKGKPVKEFFAAKMSTLDFQDMQEYVNEHKYKVSRPALDDKGWSLAGAAAEALLAKIKSVGVPLGEYVEGKIYYGIKTGLNEAFVIDEDMRKRLIKEDPKSKELIRPFLIGRDIKKYSIAEEGRYLIFVPKGWTRGKCQNAKDPWEWFKRNYPAIAEHLLPFKVKAEKRYDKGDYWWELRACDYYEEFKSAKILWGNMAVSPQFALDINMNQINAPAVFIPSNNLYLLAILNSPICKWLIEQQAAARSGGFLEYKPMYVSQLPIRTIDFKNPKEKATHDKIVSLVDRMLELNKKLKKAKTPHEKELLERQIKITDNQIDRLVYELYGLTKEEIKVVEGK